MRHCNRFRPKNDECTENISWFATNSANCVIYAKYNDINKHAIAFLFLVYANILN